MAMKMKAQIMSTVLLCVLITGGCSGKTEPPVFDELSSYVSAVDTVAYPEQGIIGLGEATHGNKEFTELKGEVFQSLITQQDARAFALEGDFGGCHKVNAYIQTGEGTAEEAAGEIGFAIYRTREMAELLEWMREFNDGREPADQIRFYGYDMQRYDNNKEALFTILQTGAPELGRRYEDLLSDITDETMYDLNKDTVGQLLDELEMLDAELEKQKEAVISSTSAAEYEVAREYAKCIRENTTLRTANNYGTLRDEFMAARVKWIYEYEEEYYDSKLIFITGHNGHIGKTNATVGVKKSMGQILSEWYGSLYYTIGTEFNHSTFLAPDVKTEERKEFTVQNSGDNRLAVILLEADMDKLFIDLSVAVDNSNVAAYLQEKQPMSSVGEAFGDSYARSEKGYTQKISVSETYDGLIFIETATPSNMLDD